ncbi:MAG: hypothetical protein BroJett033_8160 [Chloroflexota bacterium]|nr:MAG: hypothetical protein BroJett033_8160 [Chloroflexota bacterium]
MSQLPKFRVKLKAAHAATGLSPYAVAKRTGVAQNTVKKYVEVDEVITERLESSLLVLMAFYGVDWRSPSVVEVIEDEELKAPIAVPA